METKRSRSYVHDMMISMLGTNLELETNETENLFSEFINQIPLDELVKLPKQLILAKTVEQTTEILKNKALEYA